MASQRFSPAPDKRTEAAALRKAGGQPGQGGAYADKPLVGTGWGGGVLPVDKPMHDPSEVIVTDETLDGSHKDKFQLDPQRMLKNIHKQQAMGKFATTTSVSASGWGPPIPPPPKADGFVPSAHPLAPPAPPVPPAATSPSILPKAGSSFADKVEAKAHSPSTSPRMPVSALPTSSAAPQTVRLDLSKVSSPAPRQPPAASRSAWTDYKANEPADTVHPIGNWAQGKSEFAAKHKFAAPPAKTPGYAGASSNPAHFPDQTPDVLKIGKSAFDPLEGRWERSRSRTGEVAGRARAQWGVRKEAEPAKNETHLSKWATATTTVPTAPGTSREEAPTPTPSSSSASDATLRPSQPNGTGPRPPPQLAPSVHSAATSVAKPAPSPAPSASSVPFRPAPAASPAAVSAASTLQLPVPVQRKAPGKAGMQEERGKEVEKPQTGTATDEVGEMMKGLSLQVKEHERARTPRPHRYARPGSPFLSPAEQARLASGGFKREKKSDEEIERLMAAMRLKNKETERKAEAAKKDREKSESAAAAAAEQRTAGMQSRPAHVHQLTTAVRSKMSPEELEEARICEKRERTEMVQHLVNEERARTAAAKLARASTRAWDAGKMSSSPGTPPPVTSYPSIEAAARDARRTAEERARGPERPVSEAEAERIRKRDGVLNDDVGWESVVHHEGAGRAQTAFSGA
ncbi:hypothetical protein JCM10295v2_002273 [Rhodotorula toruloides]